MSEARLAAFPAFSRATSIKRLMLLFALVYLAEGIGQTEGVIGQPLNYYFKEVYQWTPVQIAAFLAVLNLPWFLKPLYGVVSDFVPLFGYRRKTYLIASNLLAVIGYIAILQVSSPAALVFLLLLTAYGMAIASTISGALLVEHGQRADACGAFVNQQWLWFNIATIFAAISGGLLIEWLTPLSAVHAAAAIAGLVALLVMSASFILVDEERSVISRTDLRESFDGLAAAFKARRLWVIGGFLAFYYFSPGIDTPLYFHMTDSLQFSQTFIGVLGSVQALGAISAALLYSTFFSHLTLKPLLHMSICAGVIGLLAFLFISSSATAIIAYLAYGAADMITLVASLALAAVYCPKRSEAFTFAALVAITNFSGSIADTVGSFIYEQLFGYTLYPLILAAALFTAVNFTLVPLLHLKNDDASN
jgi:MFS family permease